MCDFPAAAAAASSWPATHPPPGGARPRTTVVDIRAQPHRPPETHAWPPQACSNNAVPVPIFPQAPMPPPPLPASPPTHAPPGLPHTPACRAGRPPAAARCRPTCPPCCAERRHPPLKAAAGADSCCVVVVVRGPRPAAATARTALPGALPGGCRARRPALCGGDEMPEPGGVAGCKGGRAVRRDGDGVVVVVWPSTHRSGLPSRRCTHARSRMGGAHESCQVVYRCDCTVSGPSLLLPGWAGAEARTAGWGGRSW